ncbi:MAG: macrolide family glycosyltransferase [Mycobacteriales bacterium]
MTYHIAFLPIPAHGHVLPTLAVVEEMVRQGHRVTYLTTEEFAEAAASAGADVVRYDSTWSAPAILPNPTTADDAARMRLMLLAESIATVPKAELRFADDLPDGLVYDTATAPAARMLARKWNRPAVQMFTGIASNECFSIAKVLARRFPELGISLDHPSVREYHRKLLEFLQTHRMSAVPPEHFLISTEGLSLVFQPKAFHIAGGSFDGRYAFVGPCLADRRFTNEWCPPPNVRSVVLISLGTLYNHQEEFFRMCMRAFTGLSWHVVIAIGYRVMLTDLGPVPPNIEVHQRVPQLAVLRHARVFVSHVGMGSTMESLYFGTPIVAVPQTPEQDAVARRVEDLGLGRRISPAELSADGLRDAVLAVAADEAMLKRVRQMQRHVRDAGGPIRAVKEIEAFLGRARRGCPSEFPAAIRSIERRHWEISGGRGM